MPINGILLERKQDYSTKTSAFESVRMNSGNLVFREALTDNLKLMRMSYQQYSEMDSSIESLPIITTDLIWIREDSNFDYLYKRVMDHPNIPFIPISVGIQAKNYESNFKLNESTLKTLKAIEERAVIGVRGYYTADILDKHGIKNISVVGCPSLYYKKDPEFKIQKTSGKLDKVCCNFRTFYGWLNKNEKHFLNFCANKNYDFIEQTKFEFSPENANDINYYNFINQWLKRKSNLFFSIKDWKEFSSKFQFSLGLRFHGNVVSLWNNIPALFITIDSRTKELTEFFDLPSADISVFENPKDIDYYYDLANYDKFNKNYKKKFHNYESFLSKNGLSL